MDSLISNSGFVLTAAGNFILMTGIIMRLYWSRRYEKSGDYLSRKMLGMVFYIICIGGLVMLLGYIIFMPDALSYINPTGVC